MKFQKSKSLRVLLFFIAFYALRLSPCALPAQQENLSVAPAGEVVEAATKEDAYLLLEKSKDLYFTDNQYNEFIAFLDSLRAKRQDLAPAINYYTGLARYRQLRHLEEAEEWNEYFEQGDIYRRQLAESLNKAVEGTSYLDQVNLYARLALWQYYQDSDDPLKSSALSELEKSLAEYAKIKSDLLPLKKVADTFLAYGQRQKAKELYALYAKKIAAIEMNERQIKQSADDFYKEGKIELAEGLYDLYIEKLAPGSKQKLIAELKNIARQFAYKDELPCDPLYAENIFKAIEASAAGEPFSEDLIYLRAFNLEKMKDFLSARGYYFELMVAYPESGFFDEAAYKAGVITAYILGDIKSAKAVFEKIIDKPAPLSPQGASAYYQLGLLAQWEGDPNVAGEHYNKLIEKAAGKFSDTLTLAQARLAELAGQKPIEYNLKVFLGAALKKGPLPQEAPGADILCRPYRPGIGQQVSVESAGHPAQSGCMRPVLSHLWSGHLAAEDSSGTAGPLKLSFQSPGTKEINLIVLSPAAVIGYAIDFVDVS